MTPGSSPARGRRRADGNIDDHEFATIATREETGDLAALEDELLRTRGRDEHVDGDKSVAHGVEIHGGATARLGERHGVVPGAIGDEDVGGAGRSERLDGSLGHLASTEHQHGATVEPAELLGGEGDGSLADRRNAATDRGIGAGPLPVSTA